MEAFEHNATFFMFIFLDVFIHEVANFNPYM